MTSVTMAKVRAPKAKKNRTAGDWFILALLIVGGLVMLFPFIVLLLNAYQFLSCQSLCPSSPFRR